MSSGRKGPWWTWYEQCSGNRSAWVLVGMRRSAGGCGHALWVLQYFPYHVYMLFLFKTYMCVCIRVYIYISPLWKRLNNTLSSSPFLLNQAPQSYKLAHLCFLSSCLSILLPILSFFFLFPLEKLEHFFFF